VEIKLHVLRCQRTETICSGKGSSLPVSLAGILVWGNCKEQGKQAYSVQKNVFLWMASGSEFITHDVSSWQVLQLLSIAVDRAGRCDGGLYRSFLP
jgi:hypothetical protein